MSAAPLRTPLPLLVCLALLAPAAAGADAPNGPYRFEATGPNQVLVVADDADFGSFFGLAYLCGNGKRKPNGKYKRDCDLNLPGVGGEKGTVKGSFDRDGDTSTIREALRIKGKIRGGGQSFNFDYLYKLTATWTQGDPTATYKWYVKACVDRQCSKAKDSVDVSSAIFTTDVIVASDWVLDMDVETNAKNKISGTAVVQTDSGQTIGFKVKGKYDPATDSSSIKLKNKKGARITLKPATVDPGDGLMTADFKNDFLGNSTSFSATSVPIAP